MTAFNRRSSALETLLTDLARPRPCSWCLRIPPGCDAGFLNELEARLKKLGVFTVARVTGDALQDDEAFLRRTSAAWQKPTQDRDGAAANERFETTVHSVTDSGIRPLLLFDRFHKGAESLSSEMLASLRELESQRALVTLLVSHVEHASLRRRLSEHGVAYVTSNYGDRHAALPIGPLEHCDCERLLDEFGLDKATAPGVMNMTGGLPELLDKAVRYLASGKPERETVLELARDPILERLMEWISPTKEGRELERRRLVRVFLGIQEHDDVRILSEHEWGDLLTCNGALRPQLLGMAALRTPVDGLIGSSDREAIRLYHASAYDAAAEVLKFTRPDDQASLHAAKVMSRVSMSLDTLDRSANWSDIAVQARVGGEACDGNAALSETGAGFRRWVRNAERLSPLRNVDDLDKQLETIVTAPSAADAAYGAVLFLALRLHAARRQPSPVASVLMAQAVPESALKSWAAIRVKLRLHEVIDFDGEPFRSRRDYWWGGEFDVPRRPCRPRGLVDLCVAVACLQERQLTRTEWFFDSPEKLRRETDSIKKLMNPTRHSVFVCDARLRDGILNVSEAWLARLAVVAGHADVSAVYRQLDPIPLPGQTGGRWR